MNNLELDKRRVRVLFELNTLLLYRVQLLEISVNPNLNVNNIHMNEIAGMIQTFSSPNINKIEIVQHYLKRVQVNLTCIGELNEKYRKLSSGQPIPTMKPIFPLILSPPPESTNDITSRYFLLTKLFPEAISYIQQQKAMFLKQQQQHQHSQQPQQHHQQHLQHLQQQQPQPQQQLPISNGNYANGANPSNFNNPNSHSNVSTPIISNINTPLPAHNTLRNSNNNTGNNSPLLNNGTIAQTAQAATINPTTTASPHGSSTSTPSIPPTQQPFFNKNNGLGGILGQQQAPHLMGNANNGNSATNTSTLINGIPGSALNAIAGGNPGTGMPMRNINMNMANNGLNNGMGNFTNNPNPNNSNMNMNGIPPHLNPAAMNMNNGMNNMNISMLQNMQNMRNFPPMNGNAGNNNGNNNGGAGANMNMANFPNMMGNMNMGNMNMNQMGNMGNGGLPGNGANGGASNPMNMGMNMNSAGNGMW